MSTNKTVELEPLDSYFRDIDADFIGLKKAENDNYVYNATDVLVQSTWELPIVIQWPGSVVKFEFSCEPTDISFGVVFVAAPEEDQDAEDLEIETIEELGRVSCDTEPVSGSFEVPSEGVVFFMWDNNYDWTANKKLSYLVEVMQPCFTLIDELRTEKVLPLIKDVVEDLEVAYVRKADAEDCIEHNTANVNFLEEQIAALQRKLDIKYKEADDLEELVTKAADMLEYGYSVEAGLCIRMLNKHCLSVVLSYLPLNGGANKVSKYWANLMALNRRGLVSGCEVVYREPKMSKSDIQAALFPLKQKKAEADRITKQTKDANNKSTAMDKAKASIQTAKGSDKASIPPKKAVPGDSDYDSAMESDDSLDHKKPIRRPGEKAPSGKPGADSMTPATAVTKPSHQDDAHLKRSNSGGLSARINAGLSVSYDHILPTGGVAANFTTPVQQVLSPEVVRKSAAASAGKNQSGGGGSSSGAAPAAGTTGHSSGGMYSKVTPPPAAPAPPSLKPVDVSAPPPPPPLATTERPSKSSEKPAAGKSSGRASSGNNTTTADASPSPARSKLTQYIAANNDRDEDWSRNRVLEPPPVAEGKGRQSRRTAGINAEAAQKAQTANSGDAAGGNAQGQQQPQHQSVITSGKTVRKSGEAGEEDHHRNSHRMLLQHVQKIRSEQQLNAMLEYIQAGFDKIEVLNTEKRRIKKLIRAWNASFEKKNGRLPTSTERKGHLRELYEEYQQVSLALRIRSDKMSSVLTSVGLDRDSYDKLRQQQNLV